MKAYFFTEMPYPYVPEEVEQEYGSSRVIVPNSYCDPVQAADLWHLRFLAEPSLSPDGRRVAFTIAHPDEESNDYKAHIWVADQVGRTARLKAIKLGLGMQGDLIEVADGLTPADKITCSGCSAAPSICGS